MSVDPDRRADVLRRLALGELEESDPEAAEVLATSPEARLEWEELSRALRELDEAGEEEREVIERARRDVTGDDRTLTAAWFGPRLAERYRPWWRPGPRLAGMVLAAAALVAGGLWVTRPWERSAPAPILTLGDWEGDTGLELATPERAADGAWVLRWSHAEEHPRRPGTVYEVTLVDPAGGAELAAGESESGEWRVALEPGWPSEVAWRVVAYDAQPAEYAAGHGRFRPQP
jgi:hypothetical protein